MGHIAFLNVFNVIINFSLFSKAANDIGNSFHIFSVSFYVNLAALQQHTAIWQGGFTFFHGLKLPPRYQWEALAYTGLLLILLGQMWDQKPYIQQFLSLTCQLVFLLHRQLRACPRLHADLAATMDSFWNFWRQCKNGQNCTCPYLPEYIGLRWCQTLGSSLYCVFFFY